MHEIPYLNLGRIHENIRKNWIKLTGKCWIGSGL